LNPNHYERNWIRTIPDSYPDILRAPAVTYKAERDNLRIQSNNYVAFVRPYRGKQGLLIIGAEQRPIIIDESQPDNPQVLPMRLDREAMQGPWVLAVSLYAAEGLIQIEDCIVADGQQLRSDKTYKERFAMIQRFADRVWFQDARFQLNWQLKVAEVFSLVGVRDIAKTVGSGSLCLMPDLPTYRLLKVLPQVTKPAPVVGGPRQCLCNPVEGKPDVYDLVGLDGTDLKRASIQTLSISQALQQKRATGQALKVLAEWSDDFESYVVTSVLS
jgi:hypothetical protein